ncbi:hypothetical protein NEOLI_004256 [Neolecta irregularis DAH-3]|uniref:Uncharacterized protein n=1 Tax=Neolecta irregularis (strain DAH-3) TaxID=1198029 RepID=A0A1U7LPY0_NEOID|nr:hypothetical protein NEOLI_004256 [Neolecta irregularis DAH-3]|eukprot:OLL24730.1 hypothetical protein NEOLI_004256 [Neolecta irregularis DAH-3]
MNYAKHYRTGVSIPPPLVIASHTFKSIRPGGNRFSHMSYQDHIINAISGFNTEVISIYMTQAEFQAVEIPDFQRSRNANWNK